MPAAAPDSANLTILKRWVAVAVSLATKTHIRRSQDCHDLCLSGIAEAEAKKRRLMDIWAVRLSDLRPAPPKTAQPPTRIARKLASANTHSAREDLNKE